MIEVSSFNAINGTPLRINPHSDVFLLLFLLFPVKHCKHSDSALLDQIVIRDYNAKIADALSCVTHAPGELGDGLFLV